MKLIKNALKSVFSVFEKIKTWAHDEAEHHKSIYVDTQTNFEEEFQEIHSIWDYLTFKENTQAHHLSSVIGFEEWVSMKEIRRRIKEIFGIEYKNDRSLYPYLKALVDAGLFETSDVEGIRKWRKKTVFIKTKNKKKKDLEVETIAIQSNN